MKIYAIYQAQFDEYGCAQMHIREDMIYLNKKQAVQKLEELEESVKSLLYGHNSECYKLEELNVIKK